MLYLFIYIIGVIIAFIMIGLWKIIDEKSSPPDFFYLMSWSIIIAMISVIIVLLFLNIKINNKYLKYFKPSYIFNKIKKNYGFQK